MGMPNIQDRIVYGKVGGFQLIEITLALVLPQGDEELRPFMMSDGKGGLRLPTLPGCHLQFWVNNGTNYLLTLPIAFVRRVGGGFEYDSVFSSKKPHTDFRSVTKGECFEVVPRSVQFIDGFMRQKRGIWTGSTKFQCGTNKGNAVIKPHYTHMMVEVGQRDEHGKYRPVIEDGPIIINFISLGEINRQYYRETGQNRPRWFTDVTGSR